MRILVQILKLWRQVEMMSEIAAVFAEAQRNVYSHKKLQQKLVHLSAKLFASDDAFFDAVFSTVRHMLIVWEREAAVDRLVDFTAGLAAQFVDPFDAVSFFLNKLLCLSECAEKAVRFRSTQLIGRLLDAMDTDGQLDDELWERLQSSLLARAKDKMQAIRSVAVAAMERLQDPANPHCPIIETYLRLAETDSSPDVCTFLPII